MTIHSWSRSLQGVCLNNTWPLLDTWRIGWFYWSVNSTHNSKHRSNSIYDAELSTFYKQIVAIYTIKAFFKVLAVWRKTYVHSTTTSYIDINCYSLENYLAIIWFLCIKVSIASFPLYRLYIQFVIWTSGYVMYTMHKGRT